MKTPGARKKPGIGVYRGNPSGIWRVPVSGSPRCLFAPGDQGQSLPALRVSLCRLPEWRRIRIAANGTGGMPLLRFLLGAQRHQSNGRYRRASLLDAKAPHRSGRANALGLFASRGIRCRHPGLVVDGRFAGAVELNDISCEGEKPTSLNR